MDQIVLHISASQSVGSAILETSEEGIEFVSSRELTWQDSPRFGLPEGMMILAAVKGLAEVTKLVVEIVNLLRKKKNPKETVVVELPNGKNVTIQLDSDEKAVIEKLAQAIAEQG